MSPHVHAASRPDVANCRNPQVLSSGRKGLVISKGDASSHPAIHNCAGVVQRRIKYASQMKEKKKLQTRLPDEARSQPELDSAQSVRSDVSCPSVLVRSFREALVFDQSSQAHQCTRLHVLYCTCTSCTVQHVYTKNEFFSDSRSLFLARLLADVHMFCPDGLELSFCVIISTHSELSTFVP